ncbi:MAG TPA: nuclear pore complex subunit [Bacteroidales bacterium]|jgi:hypothetical protein|nr:nuclear pore complex subunit [Bacteroidales bacterium]
MNRLEISSTPNTPLVSFDPVKGELKLEGRSIPENPGEFYDDLVAWLADYFKSPAPKTVFDINLEYVNSGSSKYLLGLFRVFKDAFAAGIDIEIQWFYEEDDEAIEGLGEHYKSTMEIPFKMVEYI